MRSHDVSQVEKCTTLGPTSGQDCAECLGSRGGTDGALRSDSPVDSLGLGFSLVTVKIP